MVILFVSYLNNQIVTLSVIKYKYKYYSKIVQRLLEGQTDMFWPAPKVSRCDLLPSPPALPPKFCYYFHQVLASITDDKGEISASAMARVAAASAAEPYDSVSCAFVSYGSCVTDLSQGWKYRSRLWYGVGHPSKPANFVGGGSGWESWKSCLEKDSNGNWVEIPLIRKCVNMLQALLLDESGLSDGLGMTALYQLLDSDQPFLCMLRMSLLSLREDDGDGENGMIMKNINADERLHREHESGPSSLESSPRTLVKQPGSALLWRYIIYTFFEEFLFLPFIWNSWKMMMVLRLWLTACFLPSCTCRFLSQSDRECYLQRAFYILRFVSYSLTFL